MKKSLIFLLGLGLLSTCFGGYTFAKFSVTDNAEPFSVRIEPQATIVHQFIETKSWFNSGALNEHVYVYAFKAGATPTVEEAPFPGNEATYVKDIDSDKKLFYYDISKKYDSFVISKVVDSTTTYQTEDISLTAILNAGNNCVYLGDQPASVETKVETGSYNYTLGLSATSGSFTAGSSVDVTVEDYIGNIHYAVSPVGSASVSLNGSVATISSSTVGTSTITFSDDSDSEPVTYTLTVNPITNAVYTVSLSGDNYWWTQAGAHIYAWAYNGTEADHWYEGVVDGSNMLFTIPTGFTKADFVRVSGTISDLTKWDGSTFNGMEKWNRKDNISLPGTSSTLSFNLDGWHD